MKITLKAARVNADLLQKDVAKILNVSIDSIKNWESGKCAPSTKYIDSLCNLYKVSYDDIIFLPKKNA